MLWPTRACGGRAFLLIVGFTATPVLAQHIIKVPIAPPAKSQSRSYRDAKYGVKFRVPPGWSLTRKDREVSTFQLDARTASGHSKMRAVASLEFNPFPESTFSGALFYYSVERHATDAECAAQAVVVAPETTTAVETPLRPDGGPAPGSGTASGPSAGLAPVESRNASRDLQNIGGMEFAHAHDEHGGICVEARDEVYTAYRKGSCYRFDLTMNTFCSISSGAQDLTVEQMRSIEERMTTILSSVALDWEKSGPQAVPVPDVPEPKKEAKPRTAAVAKNSVS